MYRSNTVKTPMPLRAISSIQEPSLFFLTPGRQTPELLQDWDEEYNDFTSADRFIQLRNLF